jgi:hypothetical protein
MCVLLYLKGLLSVALVLVAFTNVAALPGQPNVDLSHALYDLDGDGSSDSATVSTGDPRHAIELQLSRTHTHQMLPFHSIATEIGSLWLQDLDGDGDTDLLWQAALPFPQVIIWLNDGDGRFACLCPIDQQRYPTTLSDAGITPLSSCPSTCFSLSEHLPSPEQLSVRNGELPTPRLSSKLKLASLWKRFASLYSFTRRGPPAPLRFTSW